MDHSKDEHAISYLDELKGNQLAYILKKANRMGLINKEITSIYKREDRDGSHIYFEFRKNGFHKETNNG